MLVLPWWLSGKESPAMQETPASIPGLGRSPGEESGNPLQYSCLGNGKWEILAHGQRSLVGYSAWNHKKSDTTEQLTTNNEQMSSLTPHLKGIPPSLAEAARALLGLNPAPLLPSSFP